MDVESLATDSQPEDLDEPRLSWDFIQAQKDQDTRKARQHLDKVLQDLKPLTNEFKNIPLSRSRHVSFEKNNQFTVVAAEFLNLSTVKELNKLFDDGYTKEDIEKLLENKYQVKKSFFTDLNVKNHRFKRKNFESWRTMSNSSHISSKTFISEEEITAQLPKSQISKLKKINVKPLKKFNKKIEANKDRDSSKNDVNAVSLADIPTESGLLSANATLDSSVIITKQLSLTPKNINNEEIVDNTVLLNENLSHKKSTKIAEGSTIPLPNPVNKNEAKLNNNMSYISIDDSTSKSHITSPILGNQIPDSIMSSPLMNTQDLLGDFFENNNPKPIETETKRKEDTDNDSLLVYNSNNDGAITAAPKIVSETIGNRRQLRHRTIANTNPYLVDRAEILGLATKYVLNNMAENGATDLEILKYLDDNYQQIRKQRQKKEIGYGPYAKKTFYDIMEDQNTHATNNSLNNFIGNITNEHEDTSDTDFELSDNMEYENIKDSYEDGFENDELFNESDSLQQDHNIYEKYYAQSKTKASSTNEINDDLNEIDTMVQKKTYRKRKDISDIDINDNKKEKKTIFDKVHTPKHKRRINDIMLNQHKISIADTKPARNNPYEISTFDPYAKQLLSFPEDNNPSSSQKINNYRTTVSRETTQKSITSNNDALKTSILRSKKPTLPIITSIIPVKRSSSKIESNTDLSSKTKNILKPNKKLKSGTHNDIIAASYAPVNDPKFVFNRSVNTGSYQEVDVKPRYVTETTNYTKVVEFDPNNARNTSLSFQNNEIPDVTVEKENKLHDTDALKSMYDLQKPLNYCYSKNYMFTLTIRPYHFDSIKIPQTLLQSDLLKNTMNPKTEYYPNKKVTLKYLTSAFTFTTPFAGDTTESQLKAFFEVFSNYIKSGSVSRLSLKELRKCLINIIKILFRVKKDCPQVLARLGLEMNSFLNLYKKYKPDDMHLMCFMLPYFLIYMEMIQNFLPNDSAYIQSFVNTCSWLKKKIFYAATSLPFEQIYIRRDAILLESLSIFLKYTKNPWTYASEAISIPDIDSINVLYFLYFCNSKTKIEMDWEYYITYINKLTNYSFDSNKNMMEEKGLHVFMCISKINKELKWDIEDQLLIKMFRLLAELKFTNNSPQKQKPSMFPGIPVTDALTQQDGIVDIYFKVLGNYSKQYLSENTKFLVERLIPIRSTSGYDEYQLHNRAKVLLMMTYLFDKDLMLSLESILGDLVRQSGEYSIKCALSFMKTIIKQTPRKPYNIIRKHLPHIIHNINESNYDEDVMYTLNDLISAVNEFLNGQNISYLKRILDFFVIILKQKRYNSNEGFISGLNKTYNNIKSQFEFLIGIDVSEKDREKMNKYLIEISNISKKTLLQNFGRGIMCKHYLTFWLYCGMQRKQPAIEILYVEWNYFGSEELRNKYEIMFYTKLLQWFDASKIQSDILIFYFKNLPSLHIDLSLILQGILEQKILKLMSNKYKNVSSKIFNVCRNEISVVCISALLKLKDEKMIYHVFREFIISLKKQLNNYNSSSYIKHVSSYIYNIVGERFDIPEWDYIVNVLKLNKIVTTLSQKLQFVETPDESIIILEKEYIKSITTSSYENFVKELNKLKYTDTINAAITTIIDLHVNFILSGSNSHWVHLTHWMCKFQKLILDEPREIDVYPILRMLVHLGTLRNVDIISFVQYSYYQLKIAKTVYGILNWLFKMFVGYGDVGHLVENFDMLVNIDPNVPKSKNNHCRHSEFVASETTQKLKTLYSQSGQMLQDKIKIVNDSRQTFEMESAVRKVREHMKESWNITEQSM